MMCRSLLQNFLLSGIPDSRRTFHDQVRITSSQELFTQCCCDFPSQTRPVARSSTRRSFGLTMNLSSEYARRYRRTSISSPPIPAHLYIIEVIHRCSLETKYDDNLPTKVDRKANNIFPNSKPRCIVRYTYVLYARRTCYKGTL